MGAIPDNQWQQDLERWGGGATWLATIQASMVSVAVGTSQKALQPYTIAPIGTYIQDTMCAKQVSKYFIPVTILRSISSIYSPPPLFLQQVVKQSHISLAGLLISGLLVAAYDS